MSDELSWRRELPDYVSVAVDGLVGGIDPDVTERAPGRVVIVMPDFTADAVAHVLSNLGELADRFGMERDWMGEHDLAVALFDAAAAAGYHCPNQPGEVA
jgi:hypothetical protein